MSFLEIVQGSDKPVPLLESGVRLKGKAKYDYFTGGGSGLRFVFARIDCVLGAGKALRSLVERIAYSTSSS